MPREQDRDPDRESEQPTPARTNQGERYCALATSENGGQSLKYRMQDHGKDLRYGEVLDLWERNPVFVDFTIATLEGCGFGSFVWETPPIASGTVGRAFEFVLHSLPGASTGPDRMTFDQYFEPESEKHGIVAFDNLGGDALLVVPSPIQSGANYSGLAEFLREAPLEQQRALWSELACHARSRLSDRPMWISVAGGGVSWLHIRLDSSPKYYRYAPYTFT